MRRRRRSRCGWCGSTTTWRVCEAADGDVRTVEVALVEGVSEGDTLLVHADVALVRL